LGQVKPGTHLKGDEGACIKWAACMTAFQDEDNQQLGTFDSKYKLAAGNS
jgi:hypothetical protein